MREPTLPRGGQEWQVRSPLGACPSWDVCAEEGPVQVDAGRRLVCAVQGVLFEKQGFRV